MLSADRIKAQNPSMLTWYWNRLRNMSVAEVSHRLGEQARRRTGRGMSGIAQFDLGDGALPALKMSGSDFECDDDLQSQWQQMATQAQSGHFSFLGHEWPGVVGPNKWHLDPVSKRNWPSTPYCFDISYRHEEELGDIKYVWELNRLQYLQPIAALAAKTDDRDLARFCAAELESWCDANPPFQGVNWSSGIELALRIVSVCVVVGFLGEQAFTKTQRQKLRAILQAHGVWLHRYPSRFSSANNHLVAEAAGLFLLGSLMPDLPQATSYKAYGRRILSEQVTSQIYADGVGAEQSPTYTAFTLEWVLLCLQIARCDGQAFSQTVEQRLLAAGEHLRWITDEGGNQPRIGDDDEGRVLFSSLKREEHYVSSVLGALSCVLDCPSLAPPLVTPHLRNLCFGLPQPHKQGPVGVRQFATGGYSVVRQKIKGHNILFVMDHGPLGYLSIAAHGHADALAIWLHIDDQPVLVDAGTYLYHSGGKWRDYFRGTSAHNTLTLEDRDQSTISGPFNWSHKAKVQTTKIDPDANNWRIEAQHDGYESSHGVLHRRTVSRSKTSIIKIEDRLDGETKDRLAVALRFLVMPGLDVEPQDEGVLIRWGDNGRLFMRHSPVLHSKLQRGSLEPVAGWYSCAFGDKAPCDQIVHEGRLVPGQTACTQIEIIDVE